MPWLDPHYKIRLGDFGVVAGIPSMGKTSFLNDLGCRVAEKHGWVVCYGSFEQKPQGDHREALRNWFSGVPVEQMRPADIVRADEWIDQQFVFINPEEDDVPDLKWIMDRIATAVTRFNVKLVIIDPWNELEHSYDRNMTETQYIGFAIRQLKALASALHIHLIIAAHPTKMETLAGGVYAMPSLYQISGSAHWFNKADVGLVVHRESKQGIDAVINIEKSRYHTKIGKPGLVHVIFDVGRGRYSEGVPPAELEQARTNFKKASYK
jgi:twinkle protein